MYSSAHRRGTPVRISTFCILTSYSVLVGVDVHCFSILIDIGNVLEAIGPVRTFF